MVGKSQYVHVPLKSDLNLIVKLVITNACSLSVFILTAPCKFKRVKTTPKASLSGQI